MLPSLVRNPCLVTGDRQRRHTKQHSKNNTAEGSHQHVPRPALPFQSPSQPAPWPGSLQLIVQLGQSVGEKYVFDALLACLAYGADLQVLDIRIKRVLFCQRPEKPF